jgi:GNAT superfamily N-acetyltransferase
MIIAYAETEVNIWGENYTRCPLDEYKTLLDQGEIIIAWLDGQIVGSIHVYPVTHNRYGFGLLNADFSLGGQGIGSGLVEQAEKHAKQNGAKLMQLEILRPKVELLAEKERLKKWYTRLGYKLVSTGDFTELKPDKAEKAKRLGLKDLINVRSDLRA